MTLWTDRYLADTRHLNRAQHGSYLLLLMESWRRPTCSLPDNDALLAQLAGCTAEEWAAEKGVIMAAWMLDRRRKEWTQKGQRKEREAAQANRQRQSDRAKKRWNKTEKSDAAALQPRNSGLCQPIPIPTLEIEASASIKARDARACLAPILGDDLAAAFVAHRKALRKPMTPRAGELMARKLSRIRDPVAAAETSIRRGWLDVFEDDKVHPFPARQSDAERLDDHLDALKARLAVQRLE